MRALKAEVEADHGPLTGILHAAGHIADAPLLTKEDSAVDAVFAPKLAGLRVIDALDDLDDVQDVYANFDIPDDVLQAVSA